MTLNRADAMALRALGVGKRCDSCGYEMQECVCSPVAPVKVPAKKVIRSKADAIAAFKTAFPNRFKS